MASQLDRKVFAYGDWGYFDIWKSAIEARTGVQITPDRERALTLLLKRRMVEANCFDVEDYLNETLDDIRGAKEWSELVDHLLVKETSFFRHRASFEFVAQWVKQTVNNRDFVAPLWVWSLGCSTGEEAYSLAMTIDHSMRMMGREPNFGVIGTDISREAIFHARRGIYRKSKIVAVDESTRRDYFTQVGEQLWRVNSDLRRRVCFLTSNILTDKSPLIRRKLHLVYCQNMLVYFRRWKRRELVNQLTSHLDKKGSLVLGLGELNNWVPEGFRREAPRSVQAYSRIESIEQGDSL